jgi:hypothetical protein
LGLYASVGKSRLWTSRAIRSTLLCAAPSIICHLENSTNSTAWSVFAGTPVTGADAAHSVGETRFLAIGRVSSGHYVFLAFT